ncbi:MAG: hypothetical protein IH840_07580 [Candidatus Heimdallarchaeota archaeon]|nr:hypothetical protein [Candidatus Heimdallarchaeota archaeon]
MKGQINETDLYLYQKRIKNKSRKTILLSLYSSRDTYSSLIELTGLKPGSLYHHLRILDGLVSKLGHGEYDISPLGKKLLEQLKLIEPGEIKPRINIANAKDNSKIDNLLSIIWISPVTYIVIFGVLLLSILLANVGVALAGSSIYPAYQFSYIYTVMSFILGWGILLLLDQIDEPAPGYNAYQYTFTVRLVSMLPGAIVGLSLYLLFLGGIEVSQLTFDILFILTTFSGWIISAIGIQYLRAKSFKIAIQISAGMILLDGFLGLVVILAL